MSLARDKSGWRLWLATGAGMLLGFVLAVTGGAFAGHVAPPASTTGALSVQDARLLAEISQRVRESYVDPVDDQLLMRQAAHGLVASLDEHSMLLEPDDYARVQTATSGSYAGIGVEVDGVATGLRIVRCLADSPAMHAGLKSADLIVRIDDLAVSAMNIDTATAQLRGPPGSEVRLTVRRAAATGTLSNFQLIRSQLELPSIVAENLAPGYGYLRISQFTYATANEVAAALVRLRASAGGRLRGLILDLRGNPGGVLEAAGAVADDFLDHGTIVSADGRLREARFRIVATPGDLIDGAPMVVLVNGDSASAAEILAAALRQNGRAMLIGSRTYGKGTVQTIMPLADGRALKLTTSRYYTPAGDSINGIGILPDRVLGSAGKAPAAPDVANRAPTLARRDAPVAVALAQLRRAMPAGRLQSF